MNLKLATLLALALLASGCRRVIRDVQTRAAFDFNCPKEQIEVSELGGYNYGAKGCGRTLKCSDVPFAGLICDEDKSARQPDSQPAPAPTSGTPTSL